VSSPRRVSAADGTLARVGVLGGGQLGRMLGLAGLPLGLRFVFVDPADDAPASELGEHVRADYESEEALQKLADCDLVTYEFENVPVAAIQALESRTRVHPSRKALATAQDRWLEKSCFRELGIPTAPFFDVTSQADLDAALAETGFPAVLKTRRFGYDGKGQRMLRSAAEAATAFADLGSVPLLLEGFVAFERELSLIGARGLDGSVAFYPLVENHHQDGILRLTLAPAPDISPERQASAEQQLGALLRHLDYVGVLTLELFQAGGRLLANEIAPRVHNSGHLTIEGAVTSQFEQHLRAVLGLPLGSTALTGPCAMLNFIGDLPERARVLAVPDTHFHAYGKPPRPGRKVGHVTVRAPDATVLAQRLATLRTLIW
jgi:5-(carboxyamino)imidazole ribonucleotide synthase